MHDAIIQLPWSYRYQRQSHLMWHPGKVASILSSPIKLWMYSWPTKLCQISISNVSKTSVCKSVYVFCWWCLLSHTAKMSRREHKRYCTHPSCGPHKPRALCLCPVPSPLLHSWREWNTVVWMFSSSVLRTGPSVRRHCKDVLGEGCLLIYHVKIQK